MRHLPVLFGYHASNLGNSHVPLSLCNWWNTKQLPTRLYVPSLDKNQHHSWVVPARTGIRKSLMYRFGGPTSPKEAVVKFFKQKEGDAEIVFLWAALPREVFEFFKSKGSQIIIERINCHRKSSRDILRATYGHLGLPDSCSISDQDIEQETDKLSMSDAVFCPSPMVKKSMLENSVAAEKLLSTSYGWAPERFPGRTAQCHPPKRPTFLFVGTLCVRKGVPLLLKAWQQAKVDGQLILCGGMEEEIRKHFKDLLELENVNYLPYTRDIGALYKKADIFVFPTLEEGGPMVTYEAMAHSMPVLVTKMGAGAIARDGEDGFIIPDNDVSAWADALNKMAADHELRFHLGENAKTRALEFTWKETSARRARLLQEKFPQLWC